jgi:hypothetical protein
MTNHPPKPANAINTRAKMTVISMRRSFDRVGLKEQS